MSIKGYRILSLEANTIYEQEQSNGVDIGYKMPEKKNYAYFCLFNNVLDYSLDLIELEKCYEKKYRKKFYFEDKYKNKYTLAVINLKFTYNYKNENDKKETKNLKELREHFYEQGFNLGGVRYVRYKRSSGSSRQGKCLFISEKLLKHMSEWGECGLKPTEDLASWEAYKSLSLSSLKDVIKIPLNGILFISDCKSEFLEEVVCVEEKDGLQATAKETLITNDIWDGESLLDESLFKGDYATKHMLLLRNKFFKSCGFKTGLQKWFRDKGISLEDLKKRGFITLATDINQIVMVTTPNSMKFLKFMQGGFTENNVRKWADKVDCTFGVVKYDKYTKFFDGKMVQSSYQFINTLGLTEAQAEELLKPSKDYLTTIRNDYDFMRYHFSDVSKREKIKDDETEYEEISDGLAERSEVIFTLMKINCGFEDTLIYNNFRNKVIESQKNKLKQGHILLSGTNATLFGNGPEMLMALSGEFDINNTKNTAKVLGTGEIACKKFGHDEKLVCARSPHITMGNLYCVTNNLSGDIWNYFDLGENIVCVNAIGENIQQRLNGCDYDSDAMLITNDKLIVETAFKQKDLFKVPVCGIKSGKSKKQTLAELDHSTSENKIGNIVNLSQKLNSILWDNGEQTGIKVSIRQALASDDWEFITLQQASHFSGKYETYLPYLEELAKFVRKYCPHSKILMHQTWAYENGSEKLKGLSEFSNSEEMLSAICESYSKAARAIEAYGVIPCGVAMMNAEKMGIKMIHRDTFHASYGAGRYLLALCWFKTLTGKDISDNAFHEFDMPVTEQEREIVIKAVNSVFE